MARAQNLECAMDASAARFRPQFEKLRHRAQRQGARAARRGDHEKAAAYKRLAGALERLLDLFPDPRKEQEEHEALCAELRRRVALFRQFDEEEEDPPH
jgi:hypothetical protein